QPVLQKKGDNVRIDWGYFYLASEESENRAVSIGDFSGMKSSFLKAGKVDPARDKITAVMSKSMPVLAYSDDLGKVSSRPAGGYIMLGYDDIESIQYFGDNLKAW